MRRVGILLPQAPYAEALAPGLRPQDGVVGLAREPLREAPRFIEAQGLEGLVVGLAPDQDACFALGEALRRAGQDPFAYRLVALEELAFRVHPAQEALEEALAKARRLLGAALALLQAYEGAGQENLRPSLIPKGRLSRRALLTLAGIRYDLIPAVAGERCAAPRGCRLCLSRCPYEALSLQVGDAASGGNGRAYINKARCQGCGLCLSACPVGAIAHPLLAPSLLDAALAALLEDAAAEPRVVAFACREAMATLLQAGREALPYPSSVLPLEVPCLGALDWFPILRALERGAAGVALLACGPGRAEGPGGPGESACPHGYEPAPTTAGLGALLEAWGLEGRLFVLKAGSALELAEGLRALAVAPSPLAQGETATIQEVTEPSRHGYRAAPLAVALHRRLGPRLGADPNLALPGDGLPFGIVEVSPQACSLCGLCAQACPTGALSYREGDGAPHESADSGGTPDGKATLLFQADLCVPCGLCVSACPEKALSLARRFEPRRLEGPPQALLASPLARCRRCGGPLFPEQLISQVLGRLPPSLARLQDYCPPCRPFALASASGGLAPLPARERLSS